MKVIVSNILAVQGVPPDLAREIKAKLTLLNPARIAAVRYGKRRTFLPKFLTYYQEGPAGSLTVPRGFIRQLRDLANRHGEPVEVLDETKALPEIPFDFRGELKPFQERAVNEVLARPCGTLSAPTGSGKTVMALAILAERKQPALVVVHTRELAEQWKDRAARFLDVSPSEIGSIGGGKKTVGERITVSTVQSLYKCAHEVAPMIGHVVVDECHRTPSRTFTEAVTAFDARYLLGLSATPWRRDKLSRLIYWHLGDLAHKVETEALQENGDILRAEVLWRETAFTTDLDPREEYSAMLSELTKDQARNELIVSDVAREVESGSGTVLVLSDRKQHVSALAASLEARNVPTSTLAGDMPEKARVEALGAIKTGCARVLVATQQLVGEGIDLPVLSTLFLATPIRFDGRLIQSMGRVLRPAPGKDRAVVFDYEDVKVGPLRASARARQRVYKSTAAAVRQAA